MVDLLKAFYSEKQCRQNNRYKLPCKIWSQTRLNDVIPSFYYSYWFGNISTLNGNNKGIRWIFFPNLEDLDYAEDIALISHL